MKRNRRRNLMNIFPIILLVVSIFMSLGYATVNSVVIGFEGEAVAKVASGIYITKVNYKSNSNADVSNSKILYAYQNNLATNIYLSNTDKNSSITYEVTIHNSYDKDYYLYNTNYLLGETTYNNSDIAFKLDGLMYNTKIPSNGDLTFYVTFYYKDNVLSENNNLRSVIHFNFVEATSYKLQSIHGDYGLTTTCNAGDECRNMSVNNFVISVDEIVIPEPAYGLMTFTKTYDPATGAFRIVRSRLVGLNFITYSGMVYMLNNPVLIANKSGSYTITIDCTGVDNYKNMTANDFYYEIDWLDAPEEPFEVNSEEMGVNGTINFTKTYDANTGRLTIQRSSIKGTGVVTFSVNVFIAG